MVVGSVRSMIISIACGIADGDAAGDITGVQHTKLISHTTPVGSEENQDNQV